MKLNPQSALAHFNAANILFELKRYEEALGSYDRALAIEPDFAQVDVFHTQRVCPVGNPCNLPNCVPPQRCAYVYDTIFFGRNVC